MAEGFRMGLMVIAFIILLESSLVVYFSMQPAGALPVAETYVLRPGDMEHFLAFLFYGGLWMVLVKSSVIGRKMAVVVMISCFFGLSNELIQAFVPSRVFDPLDLLIDTLGAGAGGLFAGRVSV